MLRRYPSWSILFSTAAVIAIADQVTKSVITDTIGPGSDRGPIPIIGSILQLRYVENTGAAFGMFQDSTTGLIVISALIIIVLGFLFRSVISSSLLLGFAFGLQFGGALGNLIDRIRLGYVVDFIDVPRFPTFNVADSGITVGVVILAYVLLFHPEHAVDQESAEETAPEANEQETAGTEQSREQISTTRNTET